MCAIVGSFSYDKLKELIALNSYRGSHSYSFSTVDPSGRLEVKVRALGEFKDCELPKGHYGIAHIQAPTTDAKSIDDIHPARDGDTLLWHNGIIKAHYVKKLQDMYFVLGKQTSWDTLLVLRAINSDIDEVNYLDGSFSCLWYNGSRAYLFRNDISPMFYDKDLNISSTKFDGSISTPSNCMLMMDFDSKALYNTLRFRTVENPYFFGDD